MKFENFKADTLYSVIYSTESHFLYVTSKTEEILYGYYFYFTDDEIEIERSLRKKEINNKQNVFKMMKKSNKYSEVIRGLFGKEVAL